MPRIAAVGANDSNVAASAAAAAGGNGAEGKQRESNVPFHKPGRGGARGGGRGGARGGRGGGRGGAGGGGAKRQDPLKGGSFKFGGGGKK